MELRLVWNQSLFVILEFDIYGEADDIVVLGDATVRAGPKIIEWIHNRAKKVINCEPALSNKRIILAVYTMHFTPDTVKLAEKLGIWLIKSGKEITKLRILDKIH